MANKDLPADSLGGNWSLVDLTGTPSSGNPEEIVALIEAIATDPMNSHFVTSFETGYITGWSTAVGQVP